MDIFIVSVAWGIICGLSVYINVEKIQQTYNQLNVRYSWLYKIQFEVITINANSDIAHTIRRIILCDYIDVLSDGRNKDIGKVAATVVYVQDKGEIIGCIKLGGNDVDYNKPADGENH